jgi:hypothetical protein
MPSTHLSVHRRLLALLPERHICAIRGPAVALRFTAGYRLASLRLGRAKRAFIGSRLDF